MGRPLTDSTGLDSTEVDSLGGVLVREVAANSGTGLCTAIGTPHWEQNFALDGSRAPQFVQYTCDSSLDMDPRPPQRRNSIGHTSSFGRQETK